MPLNTLKRTLVVALMGRGSAACMTSLRNIGEGHPTVGVYRLTASKCAALTLTEGGQHNVVNIRAKYRRAAAYADDALPPHPQAA